ncbi:MAG: efflux transporter outer membrane subunit [Gallionella sp.]|nr:efflux transporter outer membrane subunit [Gallionella sp.]MDD4945430.1 efflux transporter outer membrane subunit [Gallionella sp.]
MNNRHLLLMLLVALGGCSLAPAYQRPAAPIPAEWPATAKPAAQAVQATAAQPDWQAYFPDPRLQALIAAALEHNRDLRIATARIAEARAQYGIQQAERLPGLNLNASRTASLTPASTSLTGRPYQAQRYDVNASLMSFELDFWGRVRNLNEAAKASYLATEAAQRVFRLSLIADVANAYLSVLELQQRGKLATDTAEGRGVMRDLIARRREVGVASELDALQAEGNYQAARAAQADLQRQLAAAENLLTQLVGNMPADLPAGRELEHQDIPANLIAGLPGEVLLQRPDVLAAEQRLIAANANIGAARAAFLPRISLTGSFGTASRQLNGLFNAGSDAWSFQPALTLPLFDAGRTAANVDVAEARKVIAVAEYEKTLQQAFREVADLLAAREQTAVQLTAQQANAAAQHRRAQLVEARYRAGVASHLELLDAQRDDFAAAQAELQVKRAQLATATQLYKALAGEQAEAAR